MARIFGFPRRNKPGQDHPTDEPQPGPDSRPTSAPVPETTESHANDGTDGDPNAATTTAGDHPAASPRDHLAASPSDRLAASPGDRVAGSASGPGSGEVDGGSIRKVVVACDAGMGSSVMLASQLRRELRALPITVEHHSVASIPDDADVVLCQLGLADRARAGAPRSIVVGFRLFLGDPAVAKVVAALKQGGRITGTPGS
jgi:galactose PTS system EIIB component